MLVRGPYMRVIAYIEKHRLFPPDEIFVAPLSTIPSFTYL